MRLFYKNMLLLTSFLSSMGYAQNRGTDVASQQAELREKLIKQELRQESFTTLNIDTQGAYTSETIGPEACIPHEYLIFDSPQKSFLRYLEDAALQTGFKKALSSKWTKTGQNFAQENCLVTDKDVSEIINIAQNNIINDGWITTRVLLEQTDMADGGLKILVIPGKIHSVKENKPSNFRTPPAFSFKTGSNLNLRDIEQALDNVKRLNSLDAQIDIAPSDAEDYSDLLVNWHQQRSPFQFGFLADNSGSKNTGKYLGTINIIIENPVNLNDSLYFSYTRSLKPGMRLPDSHGKKHKSSSSSYYLNYSIPHHYWLFSINGNKYHYNQVIPGYSKIYHYTGDTHKIEMDIANTIYRNQQQKTTLHGGIWWKKSQSFIDGNEIHVQEKKTAGWYLGAKQTAYFPYGTLHASLRYQKGTRMLGAEAPPEEMFNEGTGKASVWLSDVA